jgi:hypothetical protein
VFFLVYFRLREHGVSRSQTLQIINELPKLRVEERLEIFDRLCDLQVAEFSDIHQQWIDVAINSGPARPASQSDWDNSMKRGLARARKPS